MLMDDFGPYTCEDIFENGTRMANVTHGNSSNITVVEPVPVDFQYFWLCSVESYLQTQVYIYSSKSALRSGNKN